MVWVKLTLIIFLLIGPVNSSELSEDEQNYFNFIDLNNDKFVSLDEINKSLRIIFQLIDKNKDNKISILELSELKQILELIK